MRAMTRSVAEPTEAGPPLSKLILGDAPTSDHIARLREIQRNHQGKNVGMSENGEIVINGDVIPNSDMVKSLRYMVKGTRGFREQPPGVKEVAQLLRLSGMTSSRFPPAIRGRQGYYAQGPLTLLQLGGLIEKTFRRRT